jgi:predicted ATPase
MEALYRATLDEHSSELAHHYTRSGNTEKAIEYLHLAGQQAVQRSANVEAVTHFNNGLALLKILPDTLERRRQELAFYTRLGPALMASRGYAAPEVKQAYIRAQELCEQVGDTPRLFSVLWGRWLFCLARQEFQMARELGEQLCTLAERTHNAAFALEAQRALGNCLLFIGEFATSRTHLEQGVALYDPHQHRAHALRYGSDPGIACLSYGGRAWWFLGYPDQALQRGYEGLALAESLSHAFSMAQALGMLAHIYQARRQVQPTYEWAEKTLVYATEQGIPYWAALATIVRGWALAAQGQIEAGIGEMRQGMERYRATGATLAWSWFLGMLADAYGQGGDAEAGLGCVAEALALIERTGEGYHEADIHRLKGELLLRQGGAAAVAQAEACFRRALAVARRQGAKSHELRGGISLARLWCEQGRLREALGLLAPMYDWFTEGFDTPDLQETRCLLDALAAEM